MSSSSTSSHTDQFGPNEWLVEEMYQRFLDDPNSVDPAWHDFFADYRPGDASPTSGSAAQTAADTTAAPSPLTPIEKPGRRAPHREPAAAEEPAAPRAAAVPKTTAKPAAGTNSQAAARPAASPEQATDGVTTALRGAASLVVKNMNASLAVPTATSVRAVPAKLLADNRVVINNHLRRTRGGKVSFTHMIGYAVVRALAEFPVMNRHFAEVDGKPTVVAARARQPRPRHRPARQARGRAHPRRRLDQGLRADELRAVLDRLRGHGPQGPGRRAHRRATSPAPRSP